MEIQTLKVNEINPAVYNPRKDLQPGDPEYEKLKKSIIEFDMVEPLVWNKQTKNLVGGHQRLKILKELGIADVEVSVVDLSQVKEKALNLALNKISGEWDFPRLKDLLEELDTGDFDMEITGFDLKEIEDLMNQFHVPEEGLTDDDAVPEATESICKRGHLWSLGNHRLLCGDATLKADVDKLMGGEKADMVFTDPPYNVQIEYSDYVDDQSPQDYAQFSLDWLNICRSLSPLVLFTSGLGRGMGMPNLQMWYKIAPPDWMVIWIKKNAVGHSSLGGFNNWEPILLYGKPGRRVPQDIYDIPITVQKDVADDKGKKLHPTPKQVKLWETVIPDMTNGKTLYDPFGGSGTAIIACEKLGRRCFMMEIVGHYCDVIIKRWEDFTGKQAVRIDG